MARLFTIGYERTLTASELIERLRAAGVERVVDVRALPLSRRRGFSKRGLAEALADAGIAYEHWRPLGNPEPFRDLYKSGDLEAGRPGYLAHIRGDASVEVDMLADSLEARATAVLCFEHDAAVCHRRDLAEEIVRRRADVVVVDL